MNTEKRRTLIWILIALVVGFFVGRTLFPAVPIPPPTDAPTLRPLKLPVPIPPCPTLPKIEPTAIPSAEPVAAIPQPVATAAKPVETTTNSTPRATVAQVLELQDTLEKTFRKQYNDTFLEGHSGNFAQKLYAYRALTYHLKVKTICEIGFNLGHSALAWLASNPEAHLYSFDAGIHNYTQVGIDMCNSLYPGRLTMTIGDSVESVPKFFAANPDIYCDVAQVDGGHLYEVALADLRNFAKRMVPGGMLLVDDVNCNCSVDKAWDDFLNETVSAMPLIWVLDMPHRGSGISGAYINADEPRPHKFF